ncbi:ATP phosphoribosyltransferase [Flavobacterium supellecticarium]|uniref:ATP phosphoribosyltransferase n=1 Tax=Flavobacterium supellecticarium TaxID=2565924 RepID=A0A4S4A3N8_9FLAO|nr:ATP phosphoribosyltransferase [Flavobacterium supellecticarium]THF53051.1 ATP phosphoribosyltransferase [Flavobacterium supellecticarium]
MSTLKIALQKSGRLSEESLSLLKKCGLSIDSGNGQLKARVANFPLEILFLRNSDIPQYLMDGVADLAIIGQNLLFEKGFPIEIVMPLGFSKCRVAVAVPESFTFNSINDLNGLRIATSYPETTSRYFKAQNIAIELHQISGSVEIAPNIGLADAIVDIVSSGNTLAKNNLKEVAIILESEAVLAVSPKLNPDNKVIMDRFLFRLQSVLRASQSKYLLMNVPNVKIQEISEILPALKSATVVPLSLKGWSSVQTVISDTAFWDVIDKLKASGAEDILVCPIEKIAL